MALQPFATPQQLSDRTLGTIAVSHPFAAAELAAATREIRNYCGWHIAAAEQIQFRRVGGFQDRLWIPAMQIASIDKLTINDTVVEPSGVEFDPDTGWTSAHGRSVVIKFTAGYSTVPEDLVTLTLELAAAALGSPLGISREQAGGVAVTFTRTSGKLLVGPGGADVERLRPYKLGWTP